MGLQMESRCVRCRRLHFKLFLKGDRCLTSKCPLEQKKTGSPVRGRQRRMSQYARQLREKQKLRFTYGITETQFRQYYEKAEKMRGVTTEELLRLLERRLDSVVWRSGWASSRRQARQLVAHGHFLVNGHKVWTPSFLLKPEDLVELKDKSKKLDFIKQNFQSSSRQAAPEWLGIDAKSYKGMVTRLPEKEELDQEIDVSLIVEYYSRK